MMMNTYFYLHYFDEDKTKELTVINTFVTTIFWHAFEFLELLLQHYHESRSEEVEIRNLENPFGEI